MADVTTQTVTVALQRIYVDAEGNAISSESKSSSTSLDAHRLI